MSNDVFKVGQGSLYPALHRFEKRGWVTSYWKTSKNNRLARYYQLRPRDDTRWRGDRVLAVLRGGGGARHHHGVTTPHHRDTNDHAYLRRNLSNRR